MSLTTRQLVPEDAVALARLQGRCEPLAWEHGGSSLDDGPVFGAYDRDGALASVAGYEIWSSSIAHIAVVTAPDRRGSGLGRAAVAAATRHALASGLAAQYRTLVSNLPSMGIARQLEFQEYGFSIDVRAAAKGG